MNEPLDKDELKALIEQCTIAGYEARRIKTGGMHWWDRAPDDQRRYREIVAAAFAEIPHSGYHIHRDTS